MGGGWAAGNRKTYNNQILEAAKRGYVGVTISYRLMTFDTTRANEETTRAQTIFPAQIHDAKAAVRWLRANADKFHVDSGHIGVTGASAGGHLSLLVGLTESSDQLEGESGHPEQSSRVQAVVNVFGPTDMKRGYETSSVAYLYRLVVGGTPQEVPEAYRTASPLTYVSRNDPPVLTLQGDNDTLVPLEQAELLDQRMKEVGASHHLIIYHQQGHGFSGTSSQQADKATWTFFDEHLKARTNEGKP